MSLACLRMRSLLVNALAGRASEAERLELEAHLADCAGCRDQHAALEGVRRLRAYEPQPLSESARHRVQRAMLDAAASETRTPVRSRLPLYAAGLTALAAAVVALLLRPPPSRVVDGDVAIVGVPGRAIPARAELRAAAGGHVILDGPEVALAAATDLRWSLEARTVELHSGAVDVEVDPRQHKHFRVATPRFVVDVLGTRFRVTADGVRTERGKVRVSTPEGQLVRIVAAGESWKLPAPQPIAPIAPPAPKAPSTPAPVAPPPVAPAPIVSAPHATHAADPFADARRALSSGDGEHARALLRALARGKSDRAIEARALIAESFLVERRYDDAVDSYRALIRVAPRAPQAESALYAIPQLQLEAGRRDAAAQGFLRYLAAYPHGRFAHEARDRVARLTHTAE